MTDILVAGGAGDQVAIQVSTALWPAAPVGSVLVTPTSVFSLPILQTSTPGIQQEYAGYGCLGGKLPAGIASIGGVGSSGIGITVYDSVLKNFVKSTSSASDGSWKVSGLNTLRTYDVVASYSTYQSQIDNGVSTFYDTLSVIGTPSVSVSMGITYVATAVVGGSGSYSGLTLTTGSLPPGTNLALESGNAVLLGTTTSTGSYSFSWTVNSSDSQTTSFTQTVTVFQAYYGFDFISLNPFSGGIVLSGTNNSHAINIGSAWLSAHSTTGRSSGKYWFELFLNESGPQYASIGVCDSTTGMNNSLGAAGGNCWGWTAQGFTYPAGSFATANAPGSHGGNNDYHMIAVDLTAGKGWVQTTGSSGWITGDPTTGANPTFTFTPGITLYAAVSLYTGQASCIINTGGSTPSLSAPSGYSPWS